MVQDNHACGLMYGVWSGATGFANLSVLVVAVYNACVRRAPLPCVHVACV